MNRNRDDNQLIVTFYDSDQHTVLKKEYVDKCGSATPPKDPTRPGKSFAGWVGRYEEVACNENVYATYNDIDYVVTFKSHDGIILKTQHIAYGGSAKEPPIIPVWEGHSFTGWDKPFSYITEDTVVTALYDANTIKLTFVKYKDEEEPWFDVDIPVGTSYTLPDPEDGDVAWSFDYWVGNKDIYTQDTTIIARYKDAEETSYTYEFYEPLPGGQWAKITSFEHSGNIAWEDLYEEFVEDKIGVSTAFYKLLGWAETQGSKEKINDDKVFSGGKFYAIVKELPYEIQFVEYELEDGDYQEYKAIVNCKAGDAFNVPDFNTDPTFKKYEGLTFKQWEPFYTSSNVDYFRRGVKTFNLPTTATSGRQEDDRVYMTYQARFENKIYKVTFVNYDYSLVKEFYCEYGHSVPDADVPQPTKKPNPEAIFTGWIGSWKNVIQDTVIIAGFGETPRHEVKYYANRTYGPFTGSMPTLLYTDIVEDGQPSSYTADEDIKNSMVYQNRTGNTGSWTFGNWKYEDGTDANLSEVTEDKVVYLDVTPLTVKVRWSAKVIESGNPFAQWEPVYNYNILKNTKYDNSDNYDPISPESDNWSYYFMGPTSYTTEYLKHSNNDPFDPTQGINEDADCKVTFTRANYTVKWFKGTDQTSTATTTTLSNPSPTILHLMSEYSTEDDITANTQTGIIGYNLVGYSLIPGGDVVMPIDYNNWIMNFVNANHIEGTTINLYAVYEKEEYDCTFFSFYDSCVTLPEPGDEGTQSATYRLNEGKVKYGDKISDVIGHVTFTYNKNLYWIDADSNYRKSYTNMWKPTMINGRADIYCLGSSDEEDYFGWELTTKTSYVRILTFIEKDDLGNDRWEYHDVVMTVGESLDLTDYSSAEEIHQDWRISMGSDATNFILDEDPTDPLFSRNRDEFLYHCTDKIETQTYTLERWVPSTVWVVENRKPGEDTATLQYYWAEMNSIEAGDFHYQSKHYVEKEINNNTNWDILDPIDAGRQISCSHNKIKDADDNSVRFLDFIWMIVCRNSDTIYFIDNTKNLTNSEKQALIDDENAAAFGFVGIFKVDPNDHTNLIRGWAHIYYPDASVDYDTIKESDARIIKIYEDADASDITDFANIVRRNTLIRKYDANWFQEMHDNHNGFRFYDDFQILNTNSGYISRKSFPALYLKGYSKSTAKNTSSTQYIPLYSDNLLSVFNSFDSTYKNTFKKLSTLGLITSEVDLGNNSYCNIEIGVDANNKFERIYNESIFVENNSNQSNPSNRRETSESIFTSDEGLYDVNNRLFDIKSNYFNPEDSELFISKAERKTSPLGRNLPNFYPFVSVEYDNNRKYNLAIDRRTGGIRVGYPSLCIFDINKKYNSDYSNGSTGNNVTDAINRFVVYYAGRTHYFDICIPAGDFFAPKALAPENANYGFLDIVWEDFRTHEEVDTTYIANFNRTLGTSSSVAYIFVAKSFRIGAKLFLTRSDLGYRGLNEIYSPAGMNKFEGPANDKWKALPTNNITPCILYDFNHTVEENMNDPWIIAGNASYTFNYTPQVNSGSSFYNGENSSINGSGFLNTVYNHSNDSAAGICFKQKYNIINNWVNIDFERVWTAFKGVKRTTDYSNWGPRVNVKEWTKDINNRVDVYRLPLGASKIYESAAYYFPLNVKPMEEENYTSTAITNWKAETNKIATPNSIDSGDYSITKSNISLYFDPVSYSKYKNGVANYKEFGTIGYKEDSDIVPTTTYWGDIYHNAIMNTQANIDSIYYGGLGYYNAIYEQNRFRWYKDYDACLAIFEDVIDNLNMSEYESGTITNSNYVDNSTSTYVDFAATTSSSKSYSANDIKMNLDIPCIKFNYNIYREVSLPKDSSIFVYQQSFFNTPYISVTKWDNTKADLKQYFNTMQEDCCYSASTNQYYLLLEDSSNVNASTQYGSFNQGEKVEPTYMPYMISSTDAEGVANRIFSVFPHATAFSEELVAPYSASTVIGSQHGISFDYGSTNNFYSPRFVTEYPNLIVNNVFSRYSEHSDIYGGNVFALNDEDEDLPKVYHRVFYNNRTEMFITNQNGTLVVKNHVSHESLNYGIYTTPDDPITYSFDEDSIFDIACDPETYKRINRDFGSSLANTMTRQTLMSAYPVRLYGDKIYTQDAPATWGAASGGVTGYDKEVNEDLRRNESITSDFEIDWNQLFKDNLLSIMETSVAVRKYAFTVNIIRASDNKKLAHYTAVNNNLTPSLAIGVSRLYNGDAIRRFGWRDNGDFFIPISEDYITTAKSNGLIRNGSSAVEGTDYVFVDVSSASEGDNIPFTIDGVNYIMNISRKVEASSGTTISLYTKNIDYSFSNVE